MKMYAILLVTFLGSASFAAGRAGSISGANYNIEPLVGYETIYRTSPTPHTSTRMMYGARVTAGVDLLSAELEYTKGSDTETYQTAPESIKNTDEKAKLGIRSTYNFNSYFYTSGRAGAQATKNIKDETSGGVLTSTTSPITYSPYAGVSLGVHFGSVFSISAGSTMVFKDNKDMTKNEVQNTLTVSFGLHN